MTNPHAMGQTTQLPSTATAPAVVMPEGTLTSDRLLAKIKEVESQAELDESLKTKIVDLYKLAASRLKAAQSSTIRAQVYREAIEAVPKQLEDISRQLKDMTEQAPVIDMSPDATAKDLEQRLLAERASLAGLKNQLIEMQQQVKIQQDRPTIARQEMAEAKQKLSEVEKELGLSPSSNENPLLIDARRLSLEARKLARTAEIAMLDQELLSHNTRMELLTAQHKLAEGQASGLQRRVDAIQEMVTKRQRAEAEQTRAEAERARREAAGKHPAVRQLADHNAQLGKELSRVTAQIEQAVNLQEAIGKQLEFVEQDFKSTQRKLEIAGLTDALGQILHRQRQKLPEMRVYRKDSAKRRAEISELGLRDLSVTEEREALNDIDQQAQQIVAQEVDASLSVQDRAEMQVQIRKLLEDRRELLDKLVGAYGRYLKQLGDLDFDERQLIASAQSYVAFLNERLLWIPSTSPLTTQTTKDLGVAVLWLTAPIGWAAVRQTLILDATGAPVQTFLVLVVIAAMFVASWYGRRRLKVIGTRVGNIYTDSFALTVGALGITLLMAVPWPLIVGLVGWRLGRSVNESDFVKAAGAGLVSSAGLLFVVQSLRLVCLKGALAEAHLRWRPYSVKLLRRNLIWLMAVGLPAVFVVSMTEWFHHEAYRQSLGRVAFIVGIVALAFSVQRVSRPRGGIADRVLAMNPRSWLARLRYVWYPLGVGLPLMLAVLAALGYFYTALKLASSLLETVGLVIVVVMAHELVIRWLFVARAKLAVAKVRQNREAARADSAAQGITTAADSDTTEVPAYPDIGFAAMTEQARQLLRFLVGVVFAVGLWLIWADLVPALGILDTVPLWHYAVVVDGQEVVRSVTLADFGLAVVVGVMAAVATRTAPGVLEITLLQHLPLDAGSRYAIRSITRYMISAIGIIAVFTLLGMGWSRIQWLVAALGVGLGFGLQEIVANFVSGLIILFERPIRIGDTVTVGDLSGTVARIKIRATTITDWDRKELIVPNKTFITDRLINWTLSDPVIRLIIKVGIAYGSDTEKALRLLLGVAHDNPAVLNQPEPAALFLGFGDSALNFELRAFVEQSRAQGYLVVVHELHMAIDKAFRENDIVIAFPQRDVHFYDVSPSVPSDESGSKPTGSQ